MLKRLTSFTLFFSSLLLLSALLVWPALAQRGGRDDRPKNPAEEDSDGKGDVWQNERALQFVQAPGSYKDGPGVVEVGGRISYTILLENNEATGSTTIMTDTLPAQVSYVANSLTCSGGSGICSYDQPANSVSWAGDISAGESVTVTFAVDVLPAVCGSTIDNWAVIDASNAPITTVRHPTTVWDQVIFYSDFETDDGGFSANTPPGEWAWGVLSATVGSPPAANSGSKLWATALTGSISAEPSDHYLTKTISLPNFHRSYLTWWDWWNEDGADVGQVLINSAEVYRISANQPAWRRRQIDLSPWKNQAVDIVFYYFSDGGSPGGPGWYVDDAAIVSCAAAKQGPQNASINTPFTYTISFLNDTGAVLTGVIMVDPIPTGAGYVAGSASGGASYNSGQNQVEWLGNMASGETVTLTFAVSATVAGDIIANTATVSHTAFSHPKSASAETRLFASAAYPLCEGFETGILPGYMFTQTTAFGNSTGQAVVSDNFPHTGQYAFDLFTDISGNYTQQSGTLVVDLAGESDVELNFWLMGHGDESDPEDGVFISANGGITHTKIYTFPAGLFDYQNVYLDLSAAAANAGLSLTDKFHIKFQSYDNFFTDADGYSVDDICLGPPTANISVSKTDMPDPILPGNPLTYTLIVDSIGLTDAHNIILTDTLPAVVTLKTVTATQGMCSGSDSVICNLGSLTGTSKATVTLVVSPSTAGVITNTVTAQTMNELESNLGDNIAYAYTTILSSTLPPLYGSAYLGPDGLATLYQIDPLSGVTTTIGAIGFERVGGIAVDPATGLLYGSAERSDGSDAGVLILIDPATGAGVEIGLTGLLGNIGDISFRNSDSRLFAFYNQKAELYTFDLGSGQANLVGQTYVSASGNGIGFSNGDVLYHATEATLNTLDQLNGTAATVAPLSFPPGLTNPYVNALNFLPGSNILFASVNASGDAYLAIVESQTGIVNIITPTIAGLDAIAFGPAISLTNVADLSVSKTATPTLLTPGDALTYTLWVSNTGPATATDVTLVDTLPPEVTFNAVSSPLCSENGQKITCNLSDLISGSGVTVTVNVTAKLDALGTITNTAVVSGSHFEQAPVNNSAIVTAVVIAPRIEVEPVAISSLQMPDEVMTKTLLISNSGNISLTWNVTESPDALWLSVTPPGGTIALPDITQTDVDIVFDSTVVTTGTYTASLLISSNDPVNSVITVPVTMTVQSIIPGMAWDKQVFVNGILTDTAATIVVSPTDVVDIVDRVWITQTQAVSFTLVENWDAFLTLSNWITDTGSVVTGSNSLAWNAPTAAPNTWRVLTKTFAVSGSLSTINYVTETLTVEGFSPETRVLQFNSAAMGGAPNIAVAPYELALTLVTNEAATQTLVISNTGAADLAWNIVESPPVAWLASSPNSGVVSPVNSSAVSVQFNAAGLANGVYTATLQVNSNDPDQSIINIPTTMTVQSCVNINGADFNFTPLEPSAGENVLFTGSVITGSAVTYQWNFGDGASAGGQAVSHAFNGALTPISYTVTMTATNPCPSEQSINKTITIYPATLYLPLVLKNYCVPFTYNGSLNYNIDIINASQAWQTAAQCAPGEGITVAVVDTGVDLDHPDLQANLVGGATFVPGTSTPDDDQSHGTHVAGIVGAVGNVDRPIGVAPRTGIMPVKALDSSGSGSYSWVASGIIWAVDNGAKVINLSLGGVEPSSTLEDAVNYAQGRGAFVVAAAGNCGDSSYWLNGCDFQNQANYPAAYANAMAVASTTFFDTRSSFSNVGNYIEIAAPGSSIKSAMPGGGTGFKSGTSQATPHVAGLAAFLWAENPGLSNTQVRAHLQDTAVDLGTPGRDDEFGYGRINAAAALGVSKHTLPNLPENERATSQGVTPEYAYAPGRILMQLEEGAQLTGVLSKASLTIASVQAANSVPQLNVYAVSVPVGQEESMAAQLSAMAGVAYAEPDYIATIQ